MAKMMMIYKVMPENSEIDYSQLEGTTKNIVQNYDETVSIVETKKENVGFGLQAVKIKFSVDENKGSDELEEKLKADPAIGDVVVESMDRL